MTIRRAPRAIVYPESDGKPMAESDVHRREMIRMIQTFEAAFAQQDHVYVTGNLLLYYEEDNPRASVSPDLMVVKGTHKGPRGTYLLWQERVAPCFVMEITSPTTRRQDQHRKMELYARLGIAEVVLYDPLGEYLHPALQGYRLAGGTYEPMTPEPDGALVSTELGLRLRLVDGLLQVYDAATGRHIQSPAEVAEVAEYQAATAQQEAAAARAEAAAARREAARNAERVAELEALLRQRNGNGPP